MKNLTRSFRILFVFSLLLGVVYPLLLTGLGRLIAPRGAAGSLISHDGRYVGSELIAQAFEQPRYFQARPSAIHYNPLPSGGSNFSPGSAELLELVTDRKAKLLAAHPESGEPPQELLFASGSGLDPHISPEAARYQVARIARQRMLEPKVIEKLVDERTEERQLGFLGEPRVNVLKLNLAMDELEKAAHARARGE